MASDPDRPTITKGVNPLHEQYQAQDEEESSFASSCCIPQLFCFPCGRRNSNDTEYISLLQGEYRESWWMNRFKRIKEFTEVLAGPKWKTFIRRFSYSNDTHNNGKKRKQQSQYDPLSYALNFDAGADREDCGGRVDFTVRFASSGKYGSEFVLVDNSKVAPPK
ncbi:hypothetical protein AAC387_Pa03g0418 [Persea americana]